MRNFYFSQQKLPLGSAVDRASTSTSSRTDKVDVDMENKTTPRPSKENKTTSKPTKEDKTLAKPSKASTKTEKKT